MLRGLEPWPVSAGVTNTETLRHSEREQEDKHAEKRTWDGWPEKTHVEQTPWPRLTRKLCVYNIGSGKKKKKKKLAADRTPLVQSSS